MSRSQKFLLCSFFLLSLALVSVNSQNFRGSRPTSQDSTTTTHSTSQNATAIHPFDRVVHKLNQFDWDPLRVDEYLRNYWETDKSFLHTKIDPKTKNITKILSTSCLHTAAWVVTGLLELQKRDNLYYGLYKVPENKDLIVYQNTDKPPSTRAEPVTQSIRKFIDSRPSNESIVLEVDMYRLKDQPSPYYLDHHFAIHIYNGSISLYQGWVGGFNLIDWMSDLGMSQLRYPMSIETFFAHFERFLTYTEEETAKAERIDSIWKIFGKTGALKIRPDGWIEDKNVRSLSFPWVVSLITHWPNPVEEHTTQLSQ